jgi:DNA topoisomerase-1
LQVILLQVCERAGKAFKANLPKNFNTKKEAEDFLAKI